MKTPGLIGGMGWQPAAVRHRRINQGVAARRGGLASARGLDDAGAQAVVLGCTETGLPIGPGGSPLPAFDTTTLHAAAAVDWILE